MEQRKTIIKSWHTGLYGEISYKIVEWLVGAVYERANGDIGYALGYSEAGRAPDGEVVVNVVDPYGYVNLKAAADKFSDAVIRDKFANYLKKFVKCAGMEWKRNSQSMFESSKGPLCTVAQAYAVYDTFKGRSKQIAKLDDVVKESVVGVQNDPVTTELETAKREAIAAAWKRRDEAYAEAEAEYRKADAAVYAEMRKKEDALQNAREEKRDKANAELYKRLAEIEKEFKTEPDPEPEEERDEEPRVVDGWMVERTPAGESGRESA